MMATRLMPASGLVYRTWFRSDPGVDRSWSVDVASLLLAGFDPMSASGNWPASGSPDGSAEYWRATQIREALLQAFRAGEIANCAGAADFPRATPQEFTRWAIDAGVELPAEWPVRAESAGERRERVRRRAEELKASGARAWQRQLAEEEGVTVGRVRQLLSEGRKKDPAASGGRAEVRRADAIAGSDLGWKRPNAKR